MERELHLIEWLRRLKLAWDLDLAKLALLSHTPAALLEQMLTLNTNEVESLPSIPAGMDQVVSLVGIYQRVAQAYPEPTAQNEWLMKENPVFEGNRPIDIMAMSPEHLAYVSYIVESGLRLTSQSG
ncbi:MAG: hypothetical protein H7333_00845 [Bdellovibrionales bacterium]|nr:hypothetical protein [Oligoflexia bacterium]